MPNNLLAVRSLILGLVLALLATRPLQAADSAPRFTGPWKLDELRKTPEATWGAKDGLVQEVYFAGEPYRGKPTRVFAYYARPAAGDGPFPAMVLVHGGGGQAFPEWAKLWAERGYCALAIDFAGNGPGRKRLEDGGPNQGDAEKFGAFDDSNIRDMWTYHAIAAIIRGHSLLAAQKEVDANRIGITGISWGGYLTCIATGVDDRFKVSVPVYGCGFLHEDSVWLPIFAKMKPDQRERWVAQFDPSRYLAGVRCPILFVNGTNDFAYPLGSYQKCYREVPGSVDLCITVRMPHGHQAGWAPKEIGLFVDSVLRDEKPLPRLAPSEVEGNVARSALTSKTATKSAALHYTADVGPWQKRNWQSQPAEIKDARATAELPAARPLVFFFTVTDERDATVSSPHVELK